MAYCNIGKRLKPNSIPCYRCNVIIKEKGVITYRKGKTFPGHTHTRAWGAQRVVELDLYDIPSSNVVDGFIVYDLLHKYLNGPDTENKIGRTKRYVPELLMDSDTSAIRLFELAKSDVIEYCELRNNAGAGPATVSHGISYLGGASDTIKPAYGTNYASNPAKSTRSYLPKLGLIGKSNRCSHRPTPDELDVLIKGPQQRSTHRCSKIPSVDILEFSMQSCTWARGIRRLRWGNFDQEQRSMLVRDRKDLRRKEGSRMGMALLGEAWDIVQRQPQESEFAFPCNSAFVTAGFQGVGNKLGTKDLRYHDLCREGTSRLSRASFSVEEVAQIAEHRSLSVL